MDRLQTATAPASQASVLATNKVLRNTYLLLSAIPLLFIVGWLLFRYSRRKKKAAS